MSSIKSTTTPSTSFSRLTTSSIKKTTPHCFSPPVCGDSFFEDIDNLPPTLASFKESPVNSNKCTFKPQSSPLVSNAFKPQSSPLALARSSYKPQASLLKLTSNSRSICNQSSTISGNQQVDSFDFDHDCDIEDEIRREQQMDISMSEVISGQSSQPQSSDRPTIAMQSSPVAQSSSNMLTLTQKSPTVSYTKPSIESREYNIVCWCCQKL